MSYIRVSPLIIALTIFFTLGSFSLSNKLSKCVSRLFIRFSFASSA
ncbi:membrane or secreted protein [Candidatus Omnitrophus magneticus]|uniref:Membrane or secreted protein n=1 Tax=Candidatus Omnitrophus magneticus TaxID=1609969 RepID=A0A0F0CMZ7_9BACT|nr:membrane or secreted protein [Candidatus Omnitrophus magneticus]